MIHLHGLAIDGTTDGWRIFQIGYGGTNDDCYDIMLRKLAPSRADPSVGQSQTLV